MNSLIEAFIDDLKRHAKEPGSPISKTALINAKLRTVNPKTKYISFLAQDRNGSQRWYGVTLVMKDHKYIARDEDWEVPEKIKLALHAGEVSVDCDCPSWPYHGLKYIGTILGYAMKSEPRKPIKRNPQEKGTVCKHLLGVFEQIDKFIPQIAKVFAEAKNNNYRVVTF